jgi:hypothetical protein
MPRSPAVESGTVPLDGIEALGHAGNFGGIERHARSIL